MPHPIAPLLATLLAFVPPAAGDWRHVSSNEHGAMFVDAASVEKKEGRVRFRTWQVYRQSVGASKMDNSLTLYDANCAGHDNRILSSEFRSVDILLKRDEEVIERVAEAGSTLFSTIDSVCRSSLPERSTGNPYRMLQQLWRERGAIR